MTMGRHAIAAGLAMFGLVLAGLAPAGAAACDFAGGFKTLREALPRVVGDCTTTERHVANGDGVQETTGGLLVWRKADNLAAFTDGYRTWVNGPFGIRQRLNTERFDWEPAAAPVVPIAPIYLKGVVLSDFRAGRQDDPRYGTDVPYISFTIDNQFPAAVAITDERLAFSATFVDEARHLRFASSTGVPEGITTEGLQPGARTTVLMYALLPSRSDAVPTTVELYQGRGLGQGRTALQSFALGG
jgi:hypothetical protein